MASPEGSMASLAGPGPGFQVPGRNSDFQEMPPPGVRVPLAASGGPMGPLGTPWPMGPQGALGAPWGPGPYGALCGHALLATLDQ